MLFRSTGLFLLILTQAACVKLPYSNLNSEQLRDMLGQGALIYDIRRAEEWMETGVIEGSQLLTYVDTGGSVLPDFLTHFTRKVGKDDKIIIICLVGDRSSKLAQYLSQQMGYTQVYNVRDGISRWISDEQPVTRI